MQLSYILAIAFCCVCVRAGPATPRKDISPPIIDTKNYRLPKHVVPIEYHVDITTTLVPKFSFDGNVIIHLKITERSKNITLHHRHLDIDNKTISLSDQRGSAMVVNSTEYNEPLEFYIIHFKDFLIKDQEYTLNITYTGSLSGNMDGFYKSSYKKNGGTEWMAATQFEPTHARMAFPCFDEPKLKAVFYINLTHHKDYNAISNTPGTPISLGNDLVKTTFPVTPVMSTYLVAFVISKYKVKRNGEDFEVYAEEGDADTAEYARVKGKEILNTIEDYLDLKFELPVMKQIAIPDFAAGAMENWGLVTYRETRLLYKQGVSTTVDLKNIACVIAHEFGHQWFGNLVSPDWWDYIWLNEGFATLFEYFGASRVETTWRLMEQYVVDTLQSIFEADSLDTSRPMNYGVQSPSQIQAVFDGVAYDKAGTVIRMMKHALTDKVFSKALHSYLIAKNHSSAIPSDLYKSFDEEASKQQILPKDLKVADIFDSWARQAGYPVITVTRDYKTKSLSIKQERFFLHKKTDNSNQLWWIPLNYVGQNKSNFEDTKPRQWMPNKKNFTLKIEEVNDEEWIIFNKQQTGYYRVNYDETNWNLIIKALSEKETIPKIHPVNRAQLIDDSLNLARSGRLPYATALSLVKYLANETDYIPWASANTGLIYLDRLLAKSEGYKHFQSFVSEAVTGLYNKLGFESKDSEHVEVFARSIAVNWACKLNLKDCREKSSNLYQSWKKENKVLPDLQKIVYCSVLRDEKDGKEWDYLWDKYINSNVATEKTLLLTVLGCSEDEKIITAYLKKSIDDQSKIRDQDRASVMSGVYSSGSIGLKVALEFVEKNFFKIHAKYSVGNVLSGIASRLTTKEQRDKLQTIIKANENKFDATLKNAAENALKKVDDNIGWLKTYEKDIKTWLSDNAHTKGSASGFTGNLFLTALICMFAYLI